MTYDIKLQYYTSVDISLDGDGVNHHLRVDGHSFFYSRIYAVTFDDNILTLSLSYGNRDFDVNFILDSTDQRESFQKSLENVIFR